MPQRPSYASLLVATVCCIHISVAGVIAQSPPGEVANLDVTTASVLTWSAAAGADDYNVYRGLTGWLASGIGAQCHGDEITGLTFDSPAAPDRGEGYFYLVTAESSVGGEGTAGTTSSSAVRRPRTPCDMLMRNHVLDRTGYGWDEWSSARYAVLGRQAYVAEQLDPASIDESTNTELSTRLANVTPPEDERELQAAQVIRAVYGRRQLEQQAAMFLDNHFNTDHQSSFMFFSFYQALFPATRELEAVKFHDSIHATYRDLAFNGTFREMVEEMALSPAMILYLDTDTNVRLSPNENFARELLELHTLGVDGGYTQQDIVELARVFTGWNVCKKDAAVAADPLGVCIPRSAYGTATEPAGLWVNNFRINQHDTGQKVLFAGTPHQAIIPSTAGNPASGVNDVSLALDAIVEHPATARFIATKLLQRFVTESPTTQMIDTVVAEWNDAGNPLGVGDMREVLRRVLTMSAFFNPDLAGSKLKTPYEHVTSAFRTVRGRTDGAQVHRTYMTRMQEVLHRNPVPTGYSELGDDWLDTNNLLERQNFGYDMAIRTGNTFGADVIGLLNAHGISTSPTPNNSQQIVEFFNDIMFAGELTAAERQLAIDYLNTNDTGVPSNYTSTRIRETAGFMLGFAQFLEQ